MYVPDRGAVFLAHVHDRVRKGHVRMRRVEGQMVPDRFKFTPLRWLLADAKDDGPACDGIQGIRNTDRAGSCTVD